MKQRDNAEHAAGVSQAYENVNKSLASALGVPPKRTGRPSKDFELNAKRVKYQTELLKIHDDESKRAGKPIRRPRLDKTRKRSLPLP